ncbi:hypothetical protein ACRS6Y_11595 [Bacillus cytotoxicus]|uniref:DUF340 domain-containing protein n=2 Tax=Bacillus cytotoxicus TaxID=580165 RepID=A0AAX2CCD7_9BACI|nr:MULTISPECIES: hypothetical protein [Bacillus cereus group]ABS20829.1 conserved hypothetical protein [Bacillus cytotoxicus NVH 391-98]AWC27465.1 hypothetical protein CG483_003015 [Bacillus cytotoxicus]AWC31480.1 hypothetical protein CG482_002805 [Bacillus cytotoxicus]AWC35519.1 hypothetical protein CG481_002805 [Bacillus cytotoxicus]AWC41160.1 hypothetical protein CG480_012240 [Bacillus cytotoxicus]
MSTIFKSSLLLCIIGFMSIIANWISFNIPPKQSIMGMLILITISSIGFFLEKIVPLKIPAVGYIGLVGILITVPWFPFSSYIVNWTSKINILSLATPVLAYAGISVGRNWVTFSKLGLRSIIVGIFVFLGTFLGSIVIAEIILRIQGVI